MIHCPYCGVELEENANYCSLCGEPVHNQAADADHLSHLETWKGKRRDENLTDFQKLTGFQKRLVFWKISGIILLSGMLIVFVIDLTVNQSITWSRYPLTVSGILLVNATLIAFWYKRPFLMLFFSFLSVSILLVLLDIYAGNTGWGMRLGIPLLMAGYVVIYIFSVLIRKTKPKGLNVLAYSLSVSGVLCICIDGILSLYSRQALHFGWSLIVMVAVALISALLLYIHFRLKRGTDLKRFFHI